MLCKETSSTSRVIRAVVKNKERVYFKANEYYYLSLVGCFSKCAMRCKKGAIINLLKKIIAKMEPYTNTYILTYNCFVPAVA